jgi:hypothetical protein
MSHNKGLLEVFNFGSCTSETDPITSHTAQTKYYRLSQTRTIFKQDGQLYNTKNCITYTVGTQLYIFTQINTYNPMFRLCILANVKLYYKPNK